MPKKTPGYIYVLLNPAFSDLVKIGRTAAAVETRAVTLSRATGVPFAFIVAHEEWVPDAARAERALHRRFAKARVSRRREFFRVPLKTAVRALLEAAAAQRAADRTFTPTWRNALSFSGDGGTALRDGARRTAAGGNR